MRTPKVGDKVTAVDAKGNKVKGWLGAPDPKTGKAKIHLVEGDKGSAIEVRPGTISKPHAGKDRQVRDFRDMRLDALQGVHPAFAVLSQPKWLDDHKSDQETADYYREQAEQYGADSDESSDKAIDEADLPDYGGHDEYQSYSHKGDLSDVPF